ncbi:MAG TPA: glycosyltransferase family A protein [Candidatus Saccharimonadales bacterium]
MTLALICFIVVCALELFLWLPSLWRWHKLLANLLGLLVTVSSALLFGFFPTVWAGILVFFSAYRVINLLRVAEGNSQADYMFTVARRSSFWLISIQIGMALLAAAHNLLGLGVLPYLYLLAGLQLVMAVILYASTRRHLKTSQPPVIEEAYADRDLPSLTVAIPARNETEDLQQCLESLVASTYPKLEILVLDDCSQSRRTTEIIRDFAQQGVRFVAGEAPPEEWVAKNYAYQQLTKQASGELLLFCGVDTRFEPDSLRVLVETLLTKKKTMLCVIPHNRRQRGSLQSLLVQPGRYAWELALPRRWLERPPVLSTCWLITAAALHAAGGFKAVSRSHSPESHFARFTARTSDGYSFVQSSAQIGLSSLKGFSDQRATAIRTRYPQLHRRVELVGVVSLIEAASLLAPFGLVIYSVVVENWPLLAVNLVISILLAIVYGRIVTLTYRSLVIWSILVAPFAVLYDIGLLNYSMWQYEFGEVIWKGRNVCIPVMRVIPNLPKRNQ